MGVGDLMPCDLYRPIQLGKCNVVQKTASMIVVRINTQKKGGKKVKLIVQTPLGRRH